MFNISENSNILVYKQNDLRMEVSMQVLQSELDMENVVQPYNCKKVPRQLIN